jgi:hypothetical protein
MLSPTKRLSLVTCLTAALAASLASAPPRGVASPSGPPAQAAEPAPAVEFDSGRWEIKDQKGRVEEHLGRKSLYLTSGFAYLKDAALEDGVIEVDIAVPKRRSFVGIVFRFENMDEHEIVYFRPHKSGLDDASQYAPSFNGSTCWQLYSGPGFTNAVDFPTERWVRARIELSGLGGKVFLDNSEKPVLVIEDLKRGHVRGTVGLWAGANGGHFSNFTYRAVAPGERRAPRAAAVPAGVISKWELSDAFDVAERDAETLPAPAELRALKWQTVGVEPPGMVVIDRYRRSPSIVRFFATPAERTGRREGRKFVYARAVIHSDADRVRKMSFGYSDEATVFLNAKPVFGGRSAFRYRDPGFLGVMDVENDAVYLDLKKGRNELVLAVADYFGGWGFIARLDDTSGLRLE